MAVCPVQLGISHSLLCPSQLQTATQPRNRNDNFHGPKTNNRGQRKEEEGGRDPLLGTIRPFSFIASFRRRFFSPHERKSSRTPLHVFVCTFLISTPPKTAYVALLVACCQVSTTLSRFAFAIELPPRQKKRKKKRERCRTYPSIPKSARKKYSLGSRVTFTQTAQSMLACSLQLYQSWRQE